MNITEYILQRQKKKGKHVLPVQRGEEKTRQKSDLSDHYFLKW